jgi:hypothetical protein
MEIAPPSVLDRLAFVPKSDAWLCLFENVYTSETYIHQKGDKHTNEDLK